MRLSRRAWAAVLAAGLVSGKPHAAGAGLDKLVVHPRPRPAPAFVLRDADGAEVTAERFRGQGVVLNFWATWCPPCVEEMPALERLAALVADARIAVVAASQDRGGAAIVQAFYQRLGISGLDIWLDPRGAAARAFAARGLPTTVILDRSGAEAAMLEGAAAWDAPAAVATIRRLVPPPAGAPTAAT
jgi:thiol-disulfide isomerase/thioredoxin